MKNLSGIVEYTQREINQLSKIAYDIAVQKEANMRTQTPEEYRENQRILAEARPIPVNVVNKPVEIAGVPCEWAYNRVFERENKLIVYFHGGSWMFGDLETARPVGAMLGKDTFFRVLIVNYRRAPEDPYPAGFNDCYNVYNQLLENGYKAEDIGLFGDSAGGNFCLALVNRLKSEGKPLPACVGLASPVTDMRDESALVSGNGDLIYTNINGVEKTIFSVYLGEQYYQQRELPTISPIMGDLAGLPPMLIHAGGAEDIAKDNRAFGEKLAKAGGDIKVKIWKDMFHDFSIVGGTLRESRESMEELGLFFIRHLVGGLPAEENHYENQKKEWTKNLKNLIENMDGVDKDTGQQMKTVMLGTLSQLEYCQRTLVNPVNFLEEKNVLRFIDKLPESPVVACQGVSGAYSHIACNRAFAAPKIDFYANFDDIPKIVAAGKAEFGLLPVENSSAGNVNDVMEFISRENCYINTIITIQVQHCIAAQKGTKLENITEAYSHPQALRQSAGYLKSKGIKPISATNTAAAAKQIAEKGQENQACICSELSAETYGLEILERNIQDSDQNYTKFACISREAIILPEAEEIALALSFPNLPGTLKDLLVQFAVFGLDFTKIQSLPIGGADFNVRFHLDFKGKITSPQVNSLISHMYEEYKDFQFLGNYQTL